MSELLERADPYERTEDRDGMRITWHAPIPMDDGVVLRADVFRPVAEGRYPVILTYGVYGKGLAFQEGYPAQWQKLLQDHPEVAVGSSNRYMNWETPDPERWVPHGYALVRVDSRGAGWSPGVLDVNSAREIQDLYACIEWAGTRPWSNGRVGMLGISYYASNQWRVAALQPPHLTAIIPWEGRADDYRDALYHGGIYCEFRSKWFPIQVRNVQYGVGERGRRNPNTGEPVAGPLTLTEEELARNRVDQIQEIKRHPLDDEYHRASRVDWSRVTVPLLSAANWGGQGLHPRGNFEGFTEAASAQKWLEVHGGTHWGPFYSAYGLDLQRRFFDHFLKGIDNGWDRQPRVLLNVRHPGERFVLRAEGEWPLARTRWTRLYLDVRAMSLTEAVPEAEAAVEYEALGDGVTFWMPPVREETEITGPLAARLFISSSTADADLFLVVRAFDPTGGEVTFQGALDPNTPIANGWLRASHRKLDPARSLPYRPYHPHDEVQPLTPGQVYELEVEIIPTCIVLPPGYRLALSIRGKDYEYEGPVDEFGQSFVYAGRGVGPFTHNDPETRPPEVYGGRVTVHTGPGHPSYLLVPIVPPA
ncbi:MAG TPA: CocE/NonD family hydrolase [Candidatus Dormibacteraeota bacterium]|nr:CocE/NonD family hydrolase [Candidatus Dormibacteraeota bacterium]